MKQVHSGLGPLGSKNEKYSKVDNSIIKNVLMKAVRNYEDKMKYKNIQICLNKKKTTHIF